MGKLASRRSSDARAPRRKRWPEGSLVWELAITAVCRSGRRAALLVMSTHVRGPVAALPRPELPERDREAKARVPPAGACPARRRAPRRGPRHGVARPPDRVGGPAGPGAARAAAGAVGRPRARRGAR